jgi:hypothetical protein
MKPRGIKKRKKYLDPGTIILIKQILLGLFIFSCVAIIITIIWYATRISALTIQTVSVTGGITIKKEEVKSRVEERLTGTYFRLVPKRFAYFFPEEDIYKYINEIERIKDVKVERVSGTELQISFDEYMPDNLWCDLNSQANCYFLDGKGYSFARAPELLGESLVRYYASEKNAELSVSPFSKEDYEATKKFSDRLAEVGWFVTKVEINSTRDAFYTLIQGSEIKTTLTEGEEKPFGNLEAIFKSDEFSHLKPGNFQYIDLRFGTRVFVNEEPKIAIDESASSSATSTAALGRTE